jgi:hypothetical protein
MIRTTEELHNLRLAKVNLMREYQEKKDINQDYQDRRLASRIAGISRRLNDHDRGIEKQAIENRKEAVRLLADLKHFLRFSKPAYDKAAVIYNLLTNTKGY